MASSTVVVLFYRYFLPTPLPSSTYTDDNNDDENNKKTPTSSDSLAVINEATLQFFHKHSSSFYLPRLQKYQQNLCKKLSGRCGNNNDDDDNVDGVKGRILISQEGINGTLSFPSNVELSAYIDTMEAFDLVRDLGVPTTTTTTTTTTSNKTDGSNIATTGHDNDGDSTALNENNNCVPKAGGGRLFAGVDWKTSTFDDNRKHQSSNKDNDDDDGGSASLVRPHNNNIMKSEPFPDLFIHIVKEVVNTGGTIHVKDIPRDTGKEISAEEFHKILLEAQEKENDGGDTGKGGNERMDVSKCRESCKFSPAKETTSGKKKEVVLIDVRNTFEHSIGHFLHPSQSSDTSKIATTMQEDIAAVSNDENTTRQKNQLQPGKSEEVIMPAPALNPNTVTFSHFDSTFCSKYSDSLKDKKVLMYCTGGIRCVKASAMLKQRGVEDVSHLSGGIHRYVEKYGSSGFYKGKVFVFDQRVALDPDSMVTNNDEGMKNVDAKQRDGKIVGKCKECNVPEDQISGATVCTVCRDLVLLCPSCKSSMDEYYCERHDLWKNIYFTFLGKFTVEELQKQLGELRRMHDVTYAKGHRNVRRTLRRQIDKVLARIKDLKDGTAVVERDAKRRCRTCFESEEICDGLCWGFWRSVQSPYQMTKNECDKILAIKVGDRVGPGPNWNVLRHGSRLKLGSESKSRKRSKSDVKNVTDGSQSSSSSLEKVKEGTVIEIKPWASGGNEMDCVAVVWDEDDDVGHKQSGCRKRKGKKRNKASEGGDNVAIRQSEIYRWGAVARNGKRMYDVELIS